MTGTYPPVPERIPEQPVGRVVVGVSGSLASLAALRYATALARRESVPLLAVPAWAVLRRSARTSAPDGAGAEVRGEEVGPSPGRL